MGDYVITAADKCLQNFDLLFSMFHSNKEYLFRM